MTKARTLPRLAALLAALAAAAAFAQQAPATRPNVRPAAAPRNVVAVDRIVAVVNDEVITQTEQKVGSADNDLNPQAGRFRYVVWPYLTSATKWFMIDSVKMRQSLIWFDRIPVGINRKVQDETLYATWIARMRYSYGWRDWRWVHQGNA